MAGRIFVNHALRQRIRHFVENLVGLRPPATEQIANLVQVQEQKKARRFVSQASVGAGCFGWPGPIQSMKMPLVSRHSANTLPSNPGLLSTRKMSASPRTSFSRSKTRVTCSRSKTRVTWLDRS